MVFNDGINMLQILGPIKASDEINNNSIVCKITYEKNTFLFSGEAEYEEEQDIINSNKNLICDVIKVGHHGSESSTSMELLKTVKSKYAIISVGKDNSYGHSD